MFQNVVRNMVSKGCPGKQKNKTIRVERVRNGSSKWYKLLNGYKINIKVCDQKTRWRLRMLLKATNTLSRHQTRQTRRVTEKQRLVLNATWTRRFDSIYSFKNHETLSRLRNASKYPYLKWVQLWELNSTEMLHSTWTFSFANGNLIRLKSKCCNQLN